MSFGALFNTSAGIRLIDGTYPVPEFLGKVGSVSLGSTVTAFESPYTSYLYSGSTPNAPSSSHARMVLWTLPSTSADVWYWPRDSFLFPNTNGAQAGIIIVRDPSAGGSLALPEGYVFSLGPATRSSESFGMLLWDAANTLIFDAGHNHLNMQQIIASMGYPDTGSVSASGSSLPSKPAFLLPGMTRKQDIKDRTAAEQTMNTWLGVTRRTGDTLTGKQIQTDQTVSFYGGTTNSSVTYPFGNTTGHAVPVIDATLLD